MKTPLAIIGLLMLIAGISGWHGYFLHALLSASLLCLLIAVCYPLSRWISGDSFDSLLFLFPIAYVTHSVLLSVAARIFGVSPAAVFLLYFAFVAALFAWKWKFYFGVQYDWPAQHFHILLVWIIVVFAAIALPLLGIGSETERGYAYRAYFNYDFFKHLAVTGSISNEGVPPENPYFSGRVLNYYWLFYIIPAFWMRLFPGFPPQFIMVQFVLFSALAFAAALFVVLRKFSPSRVALVLALLLFVCGGSYEGMLGLQKLNERGLPWTGFVTLNIDGLTRWYWQTPQIDTLYRALLYAPQHLLALSILLLWLYKRSAPLPLRAHAVLMFLAFATIGFGALIGALFIAGLVAFQSIDVFMHRGQASKRFLLSAAIGGAFLILYLPGLEMFALKSGDIQFGFVTKLWQRLPEYLLLNGGALWIVGVAGIVHHKSDFPLPVALFYLIASFLAMHFVRDRVGGQEVTLKLGYFCNVLFLLFAASFLHRWASTRKRAVAATVVTALLIMPAAATWFMDVYNTQDTSNTRFTTYVSKEDDELFAWMRRNLKRSAVIQNYSIEGDNARFSVIPTFASRVVFLGDRFHALAFQVHDREYEERKQIIARLFKAGGTAEAQNLAARAGIGYLFFSSNDAFSAQLRPRLSSSHFSTIFQNGDAFLIRVNQTENAEMSLNQTSP